MALIFEIPALNPVRFVPDGYSGGNRFDKSFATELINSYQNKICYLQKWEQTDTTKFQFLSDFTDHEITVHDLYTNEQITSFTPVDTGVMLEGQTFKVYEADFLFNLLPTGTYYMRLTYINDLLEEVEHISEPMAVAAEWKETLLFTYKNSENNFSVLFSTGIEFNFRVEGNIEEFQPESDDVIYADQKHNLTQLSSIPFRSFTLFIADQRGVPSWVADRVNRIISCDQTQIDDGHGPDYYEKTEGASWEATRASQYSWMGLQINIQPVENFFLQRLKQQDNDMATIRIIRKANNYFNVSDTLAVPNVFNRYALLDHVVIEKTGPNFILNIGTTPGGNEIGEFEVEDNNTCITVRNYFQVPTTVYLSGFLDETQFVGIVWDEMDAEAIPIRGGGPPSQEFPLGIGSVIIYEANETQFNVDFDLTSGLGREDTDWLGWVLCDGRNGTVDRGGRVPVGWQSGSERFGTLNASGGLEQVAIARANLPNEPLEVPIPVEDTSQGESGSGRITTGAGNIEPIPGPTLSSEPLGAGTPLDLMNPYVVSVFVKKIT